MRAAVLTSLEQLEIRDDVSTAPLEAHDVRVKMHAAGVCRTDLSAYNGTWPTQVPVVLGHEGAGEVVEVGSAVTDIAVGQRVILANLNGCGKCFFCLKSQPFLCSLNDTLEGGDSPKFRVGDQPSFGMVGLGTWSDELVVPDRNVVAFPDEIPYEIASLVGCAVMTGVGAALNTTRIEPGSAAVVVGGGGIGAAIIQGAQLAGAGIILAVDPATSKHEMLKNFGATHATTPDELPKAVEELTGGHGFDYSFEAVGIPETVRAAWDATRRGGTVSLSGIGSPSTPIEFNAYELTMDAKTLVGSVGGSVHSARDFPRYLELWSLGKLDLEGLITERISLDDAGAAMDALSSGADVSRQVIIFD